MHSQLLTKFVDITRPTLLHDSRGYIAGDFHVTSGLFAYIQCLFGISRDYTPDNHDCAACCLLHSSPAIPAHMATVLSADWPVTPVTSVQQHQLSSDSRRHAVALARSRCDLSLTSVVASVSLSG